MHVMFLLNFSVSQLREHWEDTSTKVMSRKNQIDELMVDNQQVSSIDKESLFTKDMILIISLNSKFLIRFPNIDSDF